MDKKSQPNLTLGCGIPLALVVLGAIAGAIFGAILGSNSRGTPLDYMLCTVPFCTMAGIMAGISFMLIFGRTRKNSVNAETSTEASGTTDETDESEPPAEEIDSLE